MQLFMILLGGRPKGRLTEQHDIFFGIAKNVQALIPEIIASWPEAKGRLHIDAWRAVSIVNGYQVSVKEKQYHAFEKQTNQQLFFVNLGGYKAGEFEEFHYKMLIAAPDIKTAQIKAKQTAFYKHTTLAKSLLHPKAVAHIDDKYGIDIDDVYLVKDILHPSLKQQYELELTATLTGAEDELHLGYFKLTDF